MFAVGGLFGTLAVIVFVAGVIVTENACEVEGPAPTACRPRRDTYTVHMGDWPLYRFAGDAAPGDVNGQGVGEVWYVVGPLGAPATLVNTRETSAGPILVNSEGMTLYAFLNDTEGETTCVDDCAANWPPALLEDHDAGVLDPALWSTVEHPAGAMLKIGDWPLYTFADDAAPGDVNGQGAGDVWYAVAPDGTIIEGAITVEGARGDGGLGTGRQRARRNGADGHRASHHQLSRRSHQADTTKGARGPHPPGTLSLLGPGAVAGPSALGNDQSGDQR